MSKIVYTLNNTEVAKSFNGLAFGCCEVLWVMKNPSILSFMKKFRIVYEEFFDLYEQIEINHQKKIELTEKQLIIYYAVLNFACKALRSKKMAEEYISKDFTPEDVPMVNEMFSEFVIKTCPVLKNDHSHLSRFTQTAEKIDVINAPHFR